MNHAAGSGTTAKPWELRWPTFLGGGHVTNPSAWKSFDHHETSLAYARVWPVPPSPLRPVGREFWFCPVGRGDRRQWQDQTSGLLFDGGRREGSAALSGELPGHVVVLERQYQGLKAYRSVAEYMPGHLYVEKSGRGIGLGAEVILAAGDHAGTGRPATARSFTKGGFASMRRGWLLGVERAIAAGHAVPSAVLADYAVVQRVADPEQLVFWLDFRPTPILDAATGKVLLP